MKTQARTVIFVCLHGAAKSVIAAAYLQRLADQRSLNLDTAAYGIEPDPAVSPLVAKELLEESIDVKEHTPRRATREALAGAWRVVSFGCDLSAP